MMDQANVGIVGVTGYAGGEMLRLLLNHPRSKVVKVAARSGQGKPISQVFPGMAASGLTCVGVEESFADCDFVFLALPHGVSMDLVPGILASGSKIVDLGADFRFTDESVYAAAYSQPHRAANLLSETIYGLPEFYRKEISKARLVGSPGCYPTAALLALRPLLESGLVETDGIIIDAKSGVSGAGRGLSQDRLFAELNNNFRAYKVIGHRHTAEINHYGAQDLEVTFTPHLLPIQRGILETIYLQMKPGVESAEISRAYTQYYQNEPFVQTFPQGVVPEIRWVEGTNNCFIGYEADPKSGRLIVVSVIDNLIKGAAGQAIQNFNLMAGFPEDLGLQKVAPVV